MANTVEIMELYTAYFNRVADKAGVDYWANEMDANGWTLDQVAQSFADQAEYQAIYGNLGNEGTIVAIYENLLNRAPDAAGLAYWKEQLDSGAIQINNMVQAIINGAQGSDIAIIDNKTAVSQYAYDAGLEATDGKTISLENITADPTTIDSTGIKTTIDGTVEAQNGTGVEFTLTTGSDVFEGKAGNDTITGTEATYSKTTDIITDESIYDNDTFNFKTVSSNTVNLKTQNIENINIDLVKTGTASVTLTDVTHDGDGSKVTISSSNSMFNGIVTVADADNKTIVAGAKVKVLTVNVATPANKVKIDAGSATKVASDSKDVELKTNGDVELTTTTTAGKVVINAAANSTITLTNTTIAVSKLEIKGSGVTLKVADADAIEAAEVIGAKTIIIAADTNAAADLSKVKAEEIVIDYVAASNDVIKLAKDANVTFTKAQTNAVVVDGENATINAKEGFSTSLQVDQNSKIVVDTKDITITSLIGAADKTISFEGSKNVTITTTATASNIDASALSGKLTISAVDTGIVTDIVGSTGVNTINVSAANDDVSVVTNAAADTVTVGAVASGKDMAIDLGAGNDTLVLNASPGSVGTFAANGGEGTDTIKLVATLDISAVDFSNVVGFEKLALVGTTATVSAAQIEMFSFLDVAVASTTLTVVAGSDTTLDLSALNVSNKANTTIDVTVAGFETIKASGTKDIFTFVVGDTDVVEISSFTKTGTNQDTIELGVANTLYAVANDAAAVAAVKTALGTGTDAADGLASASVTKGVLTLNGTQATKDALDTDEEIFAFLKAMVNNTKGTDGDSAIQDTIAYVSGGNTYIVTSTASATGAGPDTSVAANSIKLVGVTTNELAIASGTDLTLA